LIAALIPPCRDHKFASGIEVAELLPQESHIQWWRISPVTTNSETTGAIIQSPQSGQGMGAVTAQAADRLAASQ
jgi:hypothetical protein